MPKCKYLLAIGASAGGLEPCEQFFEQADTNSDIAYVVIQHLSPDFRSLMDELLARHSTMTIRRIEDGMKIEGNTIYLNRPRQHLTIVDQHFVAEPDEDEDVQRMPIDSFFASLADTMKHRAIAVILSGSGNDGAKGVKEIKENGGRVFVQDPQSAKFDSMPNAAMAAVKADGIADAKGLPSLIKEHLAGQMPALSKEDERQKNPYFRVLTLLNEKFGTDFEQYKDETTRRRLDRRMDLTGHRTLEQYVETLADDPEELDALYADLLIEVTKFFRDKEAFDEIEATIIPEICQNMSTGRQVRIWVPGCASGEEPYSFAILVAEHARKTGLTFSLKILATDVHDRSLSAASRGIYSKEAVSGLPDEWVKRYFEETGGLYQIKQSLRRAVVFSPNDLISDPPYTRMDLVSCRNVLIYLTDEAQRKVLTKFHFSLKKNGILFLGPSETAGKLGDEFDPLSQRWRIYRKMRDVRIFSPSGGLGTPDTMRYSRRLSESSQLANQTAAKRLSAGDVPDRARVIDDALQTLLRIYAPAGFLVNNEGDLIHVFGDGRKYLRFKAGAFSQKLIDLLPDGIAETAAGMLERFRHGVTVEHSREVKALFEEETSTFRLSLKYLDDTDGGPSDHAILSVERKVSTGQVDVLSPQDQATDDAALKSYAARVRELEQLLQSTEETLQSTIEAKETSNEELQAINEELMSSNEELQSTNEELHSVNEELYTVSAEHQRKIDELTEITSDMDHLLKSTNIGTLFLDEELRVRRFTPAALCTFNLIAQDVGRPISHITARFAGVDFVKLADEVQANLKPQECEVVADDTHYLMRVLPYFGAEEGATGVVITTIDINDLRHAQQELTDLTQFHSEVLQDIGQIVFRWSKDQHTITYRNAAARDRFGLLRDMIPGAKLSDVLTDPSWEQAMQGLDEVKATNFLDVRFRQNAADGQTLHYSGMVRAIAGPSGEIEFFQFTGRDTTQDENYKAALENVLDVDRLSSSEANQPEDESFDHELERIQQLFELLQDFLGAKTVMASIQLHPNATVEQPFELAEDPENLPAGTQELLSRLIPDQPTDWLVKDYTLADENCPAEAKELLTSLDASKGLFAPIVEKDRVVGRAAFVVSTDDTASSAFTSLEMSLARVVARWVGYIWERRRRAKELQHTTQELELIFNNVSAKIWYKDAKNRILRLNEAAADSMGLSVQDATGADTYDLFPEMAKKYHDDDLKVINSGAPMLGIVEQYTPRDGPHGWARTDKIPYTDRDTGARNLLVVASDVTELMAREHQLVALNKELDQERSTQRDLYLKTPAMMFSTGADMVIHDANLLLAETGGYTREEMLGRDFAAFFVPIEQTGEEGFGEGEKAPRAHHFKRKNGTTLAVELSSIDADVATDPEHKQLWVVQDVSARNAALQSMNAQNDELAKLNDGLAQFAYAASHDLQEPLRKINQYGELLQSQHRDGLDEEGRFFVDVMTNSAQRMGGLIKSLLVFSSAAKGDLDRVPVDLGAVAEKALQDQKEAIAETKAKITIAELPHVQCDADLVQIVFTNIITNALKYRDRRRQLRIELTTELDRKRNATEQRIIFRDNGIGFDTGDAERIFDPFARLVPKSKVPGNGIGLAICRTICDRHGWRIRATGQKDKGSTFVISIPIKIET